MKMMITGAHGQLGRDLTTECDRRGIEVAASDLPEMDISNLKQVRQYVVSQSPDVIVNCAAYNAVDKAETDFEAACLVNGIGPKNLAIAADEASIPIMHFSTDFVFDGGKGSPYTIADRADPVSRYGQSKLLGEQMVQAATNRFFLVRLSWVFGPGEVNFPRKVLGWAKSNKVLKVVEDQVSRPAYTADLAPMVLDLLATRAYGLYHLANSGICSRFEWAREIVKIAGLDVEVEPAWSSDFKEAARRPAYSALDLFPLLETVGWEPPSWQDATARYLARIGVKK